MGRLRTNRNLFYAVTETPGGDPFAGYSYYINSVTGSDDNPGTSSLLPFATITKLLTVYQAGQSVGLAKGSHWREQFTFPGDGGGLEGYGAVGDDPILDGSDIITGWTKTGGQTNVYEKSVTTAPSLGEQWVNVWEDGVFLARAASVAACDGAAGSYYVTADFGVITVYIHPTGSGDPTSNGKTYEVSCRNAGIYSVGNGHTITGIETRNNQAAGGSLILGRSCIVTDCYARNGSKHNIYFKDGCVLTRVTAHNAYFNPSSPSKTMFVWNENTPAGLGVTLIDCVAKFDALDGNASGYYGHRNVSGSFGTVQLLGCTAIKCGIGLSTGVSSDLVSFENCIVTDCTFSLQAVSGMTCIATGGTWSSSQFISAEANTNVSLTDVTWTALGTATYKITLIQPGVTLAFTDCLFISSNNALLYVAGSGAGLVYSINGCTFSGAGAIVHLYVAYTYTGDNNHYDTDGVWYVDGIGWRTLAQWQALTGQDANSTVV
jgi:hypothetical protein